MEANETPSGRKAQEIPMLELLYTIGAGCAPGMVSIFVHFSDTDRTERVCSIDATRPRADAVRIANGHFEGYLRASGRVDAGALGARDDGAIQRLGGGF